MRRMTIVVGILIAMLGFAVAPVAAAPPSDSIGSWQVTCGGTIQSGSELHRVYSVSMTFDYTGKKEARIYEYSQGAAIDSDHAWFHGNGQATFTGTVAGAPVGSTVSFVLYVLKGSHHQLTPTATATTTTYSC
jgi:hypothetical protein